MPDLPPRLQQGRSSHLVHTYAAVGGAALGSSHHAFLPSFRVAFQDGLLLRVSRGVHRDVVQKGQPPRVSGTQRRLKGLPGRGRLQPSVDRQASLAIVLSATTTPHG